MAKGKLRPMRFHCHKVRVGDAGRKGRGVFAALPIKPREAVEVAPVLLIPGQDVERLGGTFLSNYAFCHDDQFDLIGLGYASLYNHSFTPNAHFVITARAVLIMAIQAIAAGEEVCFDYGWSDAAFKAAGIEDPAAPRQG